MNTLNEPFKIIVKRIWQFLLLPLYAFEFVDFAFAFALTANAENLPVHGFFWTVCLIFSVVSM